MGISRTFTEYSLEGVPENLAWAAWMYNYMYRYILRFVDLLFLLCQICLLMTFFQTYSCRRYVLFTVTSVLFPIQGILFFVVRNNKALNYKEFLRSEQARVYRMYQQQQQQNFNRNPYSRNPYNQNPYTDSPNNDSTEYGGSAPEDPFGDLGGSGGSGGNTDSRPDDGGSPFDELNN